MIAKGRLLAPPISFKFDHYFAAGAASLVMDA